MIRLASSAMDSLGVEVTSSILAGLGLLLVSADMNRGTTISLEEASAK